MPPVTAILKFVENSSENQTLSTEEEQKIRRDTGISLSKLEEIRTEILKFKQKLHLNDTNMSLFGGSYFESELVAVVGEIWLADFAVKPYYSEFRDSICDLDDALSPENFKQKPLVAAFLQQSLKSYLELAKIHNFTKELKEMLALPEFYAEKYTGKDYGKLRIINFNLIKKIREHGLQPEETKFYSELDETAQKLLQEALKQAANLALSLVRPSQSELETTDWNINSLEQQKTQVMTYYQTALKTDFQNLATPAIKITDNSREAYLESLNKMYKGSLPRLIADFNNGENPKYAKSIDVKLDGGKIFLETPRRLGLLQYVTGHNILVYPSNPEEDKSQRRSNITAALLKSPTYPEFKKELQITNLDIGFNRTEKGEAQNAESYILPDVNFLANLKSNPNKLSEELSKLGVFFEIKFEEVPGPKLLKLCKVSGYDPSNFRMGEYDKNFVKDKGLLILPQSYNPENYHN